MSERERIGASLILSTFMYLCLLSLSLSLPLFAQKEDRLGRFVLRSARFDREDSQIREAALAPARERALRKRERERKREKKEDASRERNEAQWT